MLWPNKGLGAGVGAGAQEPRSEGVGCVPGFLEPRGMGREGPGGRKGGGRASRMETHGAL